MFAETVVPGARVVEATQFLFPYFDAGATFLWAVTGAMLAARQGYSVTGVFVIAAISACGGGLVRDGFFIQDRPPSLVRSPIYLEMIAAGVILVVAMGRRIKSFHWFKPVLQVTDALGGGAYAVVGMNYAINAGLSTISVVFIGCVNALAGSILRDVVLDRPPEVLQPGIPLGLVATAGCLLFVGLLSFGLDRGVAGVLTIAFVFISRLAVVGLDIRSQPLRAFQDD